MVRKSKVERAHNAFKQYLASRGADVDCRAFFVGVTDQNLAAHLSAIVGAVARNGRRISYGRVRARDAQRDAKSDRR